MDLGSIPDIVWGALVTGLFLVGQQIANNKRDDRRRNDDADERKKEREAAERTAFNDRAHQTAMARLAHQHALEQQDALGEATEQARLRAEKIAVYSDFLMLADAAKMELDVATNHWFDEPSWNAQTILPRGRVAELEQAQLRTMFYAPYSLQPRYQGVVESTSKTMTAMVTGINDYYQSGGADSAKIAVLVRGYNQARDEYIQSVRREMEPLLGRATDLLPNID